MRCICGYEVEWHDLAGKCPLCACGRLPAEHLAVALWPSPRVTYSTEGEPITWDGKQVLVCPGKPRTASGALPALRRGEFVPQRPAEPFRAPLTLPRQPEVLPDAITRLRAADVGLPAAGTHPDPPFVAFPLAVRAPARSGPLVPARHTTSLDEIAPRAMPLGTVARDAGWVVDPWYWQTAEGVEVCALVMRRDHLRAYATWERKPDARWKATDGYGWIVGHLPVKLGVTALAKLLSSV